jgi:hypothetical protein
MSAAIDEVVADAGVREALHGYFEHASAYLIDEPAQGIKNGELAQRWSLQLAIDSAIAAIRARDAERAISTVSVLELDDSRKSGLLGAMLQSGVAEMIEYVHGEVRRTQRLVAVAYSGRMLLHVAAGAGLLETVELLLRCGADPNVGRHPVLYCVGNERPGTAGGRIVHLLVQAGARVNACDNVKRCTALHMAARRGNVEVAEALLECGADINARDSKRVTPLGRALNTRMRNVAELLKTRGGRL